MNKKKKIFIILIIILVILMIFTLIINKGLINNVRNIQKLAEQEQVQENNFFSYQIYDNEDNQKLKTLITINSEKGIDYVKTPEGNIIYGNEKNKIGLDYICSLDVEETFVIKEKDSQEVEQKVLIEESGNEQSPIIITTAEQLVNFSKNKKEKFLNVPGNNIYYELGANIDLTGKDFTPIGTESEEFSSTFDGKNYTISNLTYSGDIDKNVGLFGYNTGTLKNIKIDNCNVNASENVAILAGYNGGIIDNIEITNSTVNGNINSGLLIGKNQGGNINNNTVQGDANASGDYTGGLIGYSESGGTIADNTANVNLISSGNYVGGCIGKINQGITFTNNSSRGSVKGNEFVGGLIGQVRVHADTVNITNSYSETNVHSLGNNCGGLVGDVETSSNGQGSHAKFYLNRCYSTGNILGEGQNVGGLIGYFYAQGGGSNWTGDNYNYVYDNFSLSSIEGNENVRRAYRICVWL